MPPSQRYFRLPLPSLSLSVLLSHSVTSINPSLVSSYLSLAVLPLACLCLRSLSTSASHQPRGPLPWAGPAGSLLVISLPVPLITLIGSSVWGLAVFWPRCTFGRQLH